MTLHPTIQASWLLVAFFLAACSSGRHGSPTIRSTRGATQAATVSPLNSPTIADLRTAGQTPSPARETPLSKRPAKTATASAGSMAQLVSLLHKMGVIVQTEGTFHPLKPFEASWAQMDYYDWMPAGRAPSDFVLRAQLAWESASDRANWWNSGCGFVFRLNARGDHYLAYLAMDGSAYLYLNLNDALTRLGQWTARGETLPAGEAELTLAVVGDRVALLVDGQPLGEALDATLHSGLLGYAIISGTNKGFGTRCLIRQIELWEFE